MKNIEHFQPFSFKKIVVLSVMGCLVILSAPGLFYYLHPGNTLFSIFIEVLLLLFGFVILKDCWVSLEYRRNQQAS